MPTGRKIRVAVVGVGNCCSSLVQGLHYYLNDDGRAAGLAHPIFGGYSISDIEIVAAFDVNSAKIGQDLAKAIFETPNNAARFSEVKATGVVVKPGFLGDGIAPHMEYKIPVSKEASQFSDTLAISKPDMCILYLPVGSYDAARYYAEECLKSRVALINGMPEFIASDLEWSERFRAAGVPCAGDDIQSQVGATILHRTLMNLVHQRGHRVVNTYQLDIGGNADFDNMMDRSRLKSKRISKTGALVADAELTDVTVSPAEYVPHLADNKIAYINISGIQFGGLPFSIELKLSVEDSPNNAGIIVDVIRAMKISLDSGACGYQEWSPYYFKHPLKHVQLDVARSIIERMATGCPPA